MTSLTNLKTNKTLFILCSCGSEVLYINYDHELKLADLAIFTSFYGHKMSLYQKLRYCYNVLFLGKPYYDQIVFSDKELKSLKDFISNTQKP
jgi:hypothetical protein